MDRAARLLRVAHVLHAHPDGITAVAVADQIGVSKRTVYRDLRAMEIDAELPIWQCHRVLVRLRELAETGRDRGMPGDIPVNVVNIEMFRPQHFREIHIRVH